MAKRITIEIPAPDLEAVVRKIRATAKNLLALGYVTRAMWRLERGDAPGAIGDLATALRLSPEVWR